LKKIRYEQPATQPTSKNNNGRRLTQLFSHDSSR
jgi:hypothetical protein